MEFRGQIQVKEKTLIQSFSTCIKSTSDMRFFLGIPGITKGISKIYQVEKEEWLSEVLQKHQSSIIFSFMFIL